MSGLDVLWVIWLFLGVIAVAMLVLCNAHISYWRRKNTPR